ncbi:MAG: efflux RND transporter periplasmic adaptor subunit [Chlorobiales bacterium]|nr:efflux RND transporter periplasmic adaptor subunit [Chlorobiales bacterium]
MKRNAIIIVVVLGIALGGGLLYRSSFLKSGSGESVEKKAGQEERGKVGSVKMTALIQKENGVIVVSANKQILREVINVTGKVAVNADRMAHVSPHIQGKIIAVKASLGDSVFVGQPLAVIESVELGDALSRYIQSKSKVALAQSSMERVKGLVEKKIAARKELLQAESDLKIDRTELQANKERLTLYGISTSDLKNENYQKPHLVVRSPIGGVITEKHAIVGELSDPSKSLYTVVDLSSVWVLVDINEKDISKVQKGQLAVFTVAALPGQKLQGRITYIADVVDEATHTVKARLTVANSGRKLKPEMFATVELTQPSLAVTALAVPEEALQDIDGKKVLFVTGNGTDFLPRPVEAGRISGGMVEIVSGLKDKERYAAKGSFILKSELKRSELEGD